MAFNLRKLLNDSDDLHDSITKFCEPYCDPVKNPEALCPIPCISLCYTICNRALFFDITPPPPPDFLSGSNDHHSDRSYRLSIFLTSILAILATTFFIFSCYTVYKLTTAWYRSRRQPPQQPRPQEEETYEHFLGEGRGLIGVDHPIWYIRTVGVQSSAIRAISVCKYKRSDGLVEGTECSVCLNEFQEDETLRLLPKCNHAFHISCIDTWLGSHTNCPMCRADILINSLSLQSPEQSTPSLGHLEESQVENSEYQSESWSGRERGDSSIEVEDEEELWVQNASRMNEDFGEDVGNSDSREGDGIQPMRRSVSMDSLSATVISGAVSDAVSANSDGNLDEQCNQMIESNMGFAAKRVDHDQYSVGRSSIERSERFIWGEEITFMQCQGVLITVQQKQKLRSSFMKCLISVCYKFSVEICIIRCPENFLKNLRISIGQNIMLRIFLEWTRSCKRKEKG